MNFYRNIQLMVGDNFTSIEDHQLDSVINFCNCAETLCKEIDTEFYGACYDKEKKAFCISVLTAEVTLKKGGGFWNIMDIVDAVRFRKLSEDDQLPFKVFNKDRQAPEIELEFWIYLGEESAGCDHQGNKNDQ